MKIAVAAFIFMLLLPSAAFAIRINEIMYNPPSKTDAYDEWVEIWNDGSQAVDMTGWRLCGTILKAGYVVAPRGDKPIHDTGMSLPANAYAIVTDGGSGSTMLDNFTVDGNALLLHVDAGSMCGVLNNDGDTVILTGTNGVVDNVTYTNIAREGFSIEHNSTGWFESLVVKGTPGAVNSIIQQAVEEQNEQPEEEQEPAVQDEQQAPQDLLENEQDTETDDNAVPVAPKAISNVGSITMTLPNAPSYAESGSSFMLPVRLVSNFSIVKILELSAYAFSDYDTATAGGFNPGTYTFVLEPGEVRTVELPIEVRQDINGTFTLRTRATDGNSTWSADAQLAVVRPYSEIGQPSDVSSSPTGAFTVNIDLAGIFGQLMAGIWSRITEFLSGFKFQNIVSG